MKFQHDDNNYSTKRRTASSPTPEADRYYRKILAQRATPSDSSLSPFDKIAIVVIIILMMFWTLVILSLTIALQDATLFLGVFIALMAYWCIIWIAYYVGWKFYWIMLAIGWMLATGYALTILGALQRAFYQLL